MDNKQGLIVNMGSLAGLFGLPYQSMYSASKYAIEGYSQSLRMELRNTGVKVVVINPGDFKTGFTQSREKLPFTITNPKLQDEYNVAVASIEKDEAAGQSPDMIANKLCKIVDTANPSHSYLVGAFGQIIAPTLKRLLPGSLFEKLMNDHYGIK